MQPLASMTQLVSELYPLHRTLVSEGTDRALEIVGAYMPQQAGYSLECFSPGKPVWTWRVPERYLVHEAYLEIVGGERIVDFQDNPLHLVSYSLPVDRFLDWEALEPHLHFSAKRPRAIPWEFKYYERDWGFCLSKEQFDSLPRDRQYHAVIRSEFATDPRHGLRVGVGVVAPEGGQVEGVGEVLVCAHVCHPHQANDDATGVATVVEIARRLVNRPLTAGSMSVRFLFCPETIGSICYLSHHEDLIRGLKAAIFVEMPANRNVLALQRTRQGDHLMDRIARHVLEKQGVPFREGAFRDIIRNDEMVINGPGVNVPCISISRWPYDEYHSSDDDMSIVHEEMMVEVADIVEEVIQVFASNYLPRRTFRGPLFLSGHGLWVDWRLNRELNRAVEKIMLRMEGRDSIFDISADLGLDYQEVRSYVERFRAQGLVEALAVPSVSETG